MQHPVWLLSQNNCVYALCHVTGITCHTDEGDKQDAEVLEVKFSRDGFFGVAYSMLHGFKSTNPPYPLVSLPLESYIL